jgi:flavin-dependent thymidylate synthase
MPEEAIGGPVVTLLNVTPDPLGSIAALCAMYEGRVVRNLGELSDQERVEAFRAMQATALNGPLEGVLFHFLIEGVSRAWTHQAVRERQAFEAQESLRFAVKEGWEDEAHWPPSIAEGSEAADIYASTLAAVAKSYEDLVTIGIPAEDARGLLPHATTTRLHMVFNLRTLMHMAGLRLCTQAQFEWRLVMAGIVNALREKMAELQKREMELFAKSGALSLPADRAGWQFGFLANQLRPICYQEGRCGFMAKFDRNCTIRKRVEVFAINRISSDQWHDERRHGPMAIRPAEWAADHTAARRS